MTAIRIYVDGDRVGPVFKRMGDKVRAAARGAAKDAADAILEQGKADISGAGRFGSRWTDGLHADVTEGGGNIKIAVTHDVPYWRVFEYGATISGKPMLWIPISDSEKGISARDFGGMLFRVDRKADGLPLLLMPGHPAQVKYFGKSSVTIPKKFTLTEISRDVARKIKSFYSERVRSDG